MISIFGGFVKRYSILVHQRNEKIDIFPVPIYNESRCREKRVMGLIFIYTEKREEESWILKNDLYFNLCTGNLPLTEEDKKIIFQIDQAVVTEDNRIETKYGIGTIRNLSSGCKTYLNVLKNPGKTVSVSECGRNVLDMLFRLDDIRLYMGFPERFEIGGDVRMMMNDTEIVVGKKGYEAWWNREYERRAADDLSDD